MYDGYQVLRFENNYKSKYLYLIGNEMNNRIGTGNYDSERTKFNVHYKDINKSNLYQEVKSILEDRNIEYSRKTKANILNGVTFTSGPEFFMTLGLPFKETNRIYQSGDKKGQNILAPDIKSKEVLENNIKNNNLNIKKNIIGYSSKDVEKLIDHYNDLERLNNINKNKLDFNENTINRLSIENNFYKNNKELIDSKKYIYKQNIELKNKDDEID